MSIIHEQQMREALRIAAEGAALGEVPVGALVVRNSEIIAFAHNETEQQTSATAHAEILAIERASKKLGRWRLDDCQLYVTLEPCPMCIGAILLARIPELFFGCFDPNFGAVGSLFDLSAHASIPQRVTVFPQLLEHDCRVMLQGFFQKRRSL